MSLSSSPWASGLLAVLLIYLFGAPTATPDPTPAAAPAVAVRSIAAVAAPDTRIPRPTSTSPTTSPTTATPTSPTVAVGAPTTSPSLSHSSSQAHAASPAAPAPRGTTTTRPGHEAAPAPGSDLAESAVSLMPAPASRVGLIGLATLLVAFAVVFVLSGRRTGARTRADCFRARR